MIYTLMMLINPFFQKLLTSDMNTEFTQHCDTSDTQITQLNESFDEDYIEEIFKRMYFLRGLCIFSDQCSTEYFINADTQFGEGCLSIK